MSILSSNPHVDKAYAWGFADGQQGIDNRAWEYYVPWSATEDAYNLGFLVGMAKRQTRRLAGGSPVNQVSEEQAMDQDLAALRSGRMQPILRYTDEMMHQIEDERF